MKAIRFNLKGPSARNRTNLMQAVLIRTAFGGRRVWEVRRQNGLYQVLVQRCHIDVKNRVDGLGCSCYTSVSDRRNLMMLSARTLALLLVCFSFVVFGLSSNTVLADGHEQPDWYEEDTPWEDLSPEQQKAKYTSYYIDDLGGSITILNNRYKANKGKYETDATALQNAIAAIGGAGAPGALPAAPATPPANLAGLAALTTAMNTWLAAYNAWYAGLTPAQQAQLDPLFGQVLNSYQRLVAIAVAILDLKQARGEAEVGLLERCRHYDG